MDERSWWRLGLWALLVVNLFGLRYVFRSEDFWTYFENHDTRIIATRIYDTGPQASWFAGDWPLQNGFYRPLPSMSFALDVHLFGMRLELYKIQTWLLALLCSFGVLWFAWETTRKQSTALACGLMFAVWQTGVLEALPLGLIVQGCAFFVLIYGLAKKLPILPVVLLAALLFGLPYELFSPPGDDMWHQPFSYRAMGWPPGRTATIMALFALPCVASYLRWERDREPKWLVVSTLCLLLSLMSYEQSVVLGPCLIACAVYLAKLGFRPRWAYPTAATAAVLAYYIAHDKLLPMTTSYQQMHRQGPYDGLLAFTNWIFPSLKQLKVFDIFVDHRQLLLTIVVAAFWGALLHLATKLAPILVSKTKWQPAYFSLGVSIIAFAPMCLAKPLFHYWYLPAAFRTVFVWTLVEAGIGLWRQMHTAKVLEGHAVIEQVVSRPVQPIPAALQP